MFKSSIQLEVEYAVGVPVTLSQQVAQAVSSKVTIFGADFVMSTGDRADQDLSRMLSKISRWVVEMVERDM